MDDTTREELEYLRDKSRKKADRCKELIESGTISYAEERYFRGVRSECEWITDALDIMLKGEGFLGNF